MSVAPIDGFTVDDLDDLDLPPGARVEIIDGSLHVTPPPTVAHQVVAHRLGRVIEEQLPPTVLLLEGVGVGDQQRLFVPDLVVADAAGVADARSRDARFLPPDVVRLAVEVVSPSSRTHDWVTKPNAYPTMGISGLWVIDPTTGRAAAGGHGELFAVRTDTLAVTLDGVTITVDLAAALA